MRGPAERQLELTKGLGSEKRHALELQAIMTSFLVLGHSNKE